MAGKRRALALGALAAGGTAAAMVRHRRTIAADPEWPRLQTVPSGRALSVQSADGTTLHVEVFGDEQAPTIVLIHGWTESIPYWTYVIEDLQRDHRVVAYDLRGHGKSGRAVDSDYALARFGEDLQAVLVSCVPDGRRATVAGHSLGAMSIAAWAEHHDVPARVGAVALLNTGLGNLIADSKLVAIPAFAGSLRDPIGRKLFLGAPSPIPAFSSPLHHAVIRHVAFGPSAGSAVIEFYARMIATCPPDVRAAVGLAMADMELHHALARLTVPTLAMAGSNDRLTPPSHARRIAAELPNPAELIELPATGHMGPLERPAEVSAALRALAARAESSSQLAVA